MTGKTWTLVSAAAIALAACSPKVDNSSNTIVSTTSESNDVMPTNEMAGNDMAPAPVPTGAQAFVNTAAASDAFEIAASNLALASAKSDAVKAFAHQMIKAHTGSTAKLKGIVAGLTPPLTPDATLGADQQSMLDGLKSKSGTDFDTAFAAAQVTAHQAALDALKGYAATGDVPQLKTFASGLVPTVEGHLKMAQALK